MLLPLNRPAHLVVEPHRITARMPKAGRPEIAVVTPVTKPEGALGPYEGIGNAIRDTLLQWSGTAGRPLYGPRRLNVEVADTFVHYDVLHVDARRLPPAELEHLAAVGLADTLGLDPSSLVMRCSVQQDGLSVVVCGMPSPLVEAVKQAIDDAGYSLNRLEPGFAAFWNGSHARTKKDSALLAYLRGSALMLGWLRDGKWQALATEHLSRNDWAVLRDSCDAFCRRICVPDHAILPILFDADIGEIPAEARSRWHRLSPGSAVAPDLTSDFA